MSLNQHTNNGINILERIDVTEFVRKFLVINKKTEWWLPLRPNTLNEAEQVKEFLNNPKNTASKSMRDLETGFHYWDEQKVDFVPSNLGEGRGYLFFFNCNGCNHRVKYLYQYSYCNTPLCRLCCRLKYKAPSRKERSLSRLLRRPYFSSETRFMIAKHAGIMKEDIPERVTG